MICPECGLDHALADVTNAFLGTILFDSKQNAENGAKLMLRLIEWMKREDLTIAPESPEQVN